MILEVTQVNSDSITFDNGYVLESDHYQDCCESHWLDFSDLTIEDFEGLKFDISSEETLFERIPDYGIALKSLNGHPVRVLGYGSNNGYYNSSLDLRISGKGFEVRFDISECQLWNDY